MMGLGVVGSTDFAGGHPLDQTHWISQHAGCQMGSSPKPAVKSCLVQIFSNAAIELEGFGIISRFSNARGSHPLIAFQALFELPRNLSDKRPAFTDKFQKKFNCRTVRKTFQTFNFQSHLNFYGYLTNFCYTISDFLEMWLVFFFLKKKTWTRLVLTAFRFILTSQLRFKLFEKRRKQFLCHWTSSKKNKY